VIKRIYSRFRDPARTGYKLYRQLWFLRKQPTCTAKSLLKLSIIQNILIASGVVPVHTERVLLKLNISLGTPSPLSDQLSSRSSQSTPKTPRRVAQLHKPVSMLKYLLDWRSKSPLSRHFVCTPLEYLWARSLRVSDY
jgi:hypothetical protein